MNEPSGFLSDTSGERERGERTERERDRDRDRDTERDRERQRETDRHTDTERYMHACVHSFHYVWMNWYSYDCSVISLIFLSFQCLRVPYSVYLN